MAGEQLITVVGRLTNDPELRFTPSGAAVANFTVASNARTFDKQSNEWKDEPANFWRCAVWREQAENVAESLTKGTGVILQGIVKTRSYETKEGEKRSVQELDVQNIGPDLRWVTAKLARGGSKAQNPAGGGFGQQGGTGGFGAQPGGSGFGGQSQADPWGAASNANAGGWGNAADPSEPPF